VSLANTLDITFSHVGLFVSDLERMADFYMQALGFLQTDRGRLGNNELVFLSRNTADHHQLVLCTGRPADLTFNVVNQISFRLGSLPQLRAVHALLERCGAEDLRPINHGISWSVYARDPEGTRLELFVDSPWYVCQPLREPLDLSLDDAAIVATTERACQADPTFRPMSEWRAAFAERLRAAADKMKAGNAAAV
jgi:catechol 2,3-dioxygenase